jgi:uncharacterized NAD-dependent epimerase/dehydratase family protein
MIDYLEDYAIIYCENEFGKTNGKTANGLVRKSKKFKILSIIDSSKTGYDTGLILDGKENGIPIYSSITEAYNYCKNINKIPTHFIIGLTPDGGRLPSSSRVDILKSIDLGLNVVSGLHDFLSDDKEFIQKAKKKNIQITDIRKTPPRDKLHFYSGKIEDVDSYIIAILGTDSAVGKRTTAWCLYDNLIKEGFKVKFIGTGQTSWLQGADYCIILDSLINDFVSGEIEHAVWSAWNDSHPDIIIIEGQGSLLNPVYPGGFEILAAGRPNAIILQHAPKRKYYDGFSGYNIHSLEKQIQSLEMISEKPVIAITINHEEIKNLEIDEICKKISKETGLLCIDVLTHGSDELIKVINNNLK